MRRSLKFSRKTPQRSISVELTQRALDRLDELCKHYGFRKKAVVERVIEWFSSLPAEEVIRIMTASVPPLSPPPSKQ